MDAKVYYITRWYDKGLNLWHTASPVETREQAEQGLAFLASVQGDDVTIELVEITRRLLKSLQGGQRRE